MSHFEVETGECYKVIRMTILSTRLIPNRLNSQKREPRGSNLVLEAFLGIIGPTRECLGHFNLAHKSNFGINIRQPKFEDLG